MEAHGFLQIRRMGIAAQEARCLSKYVSKAGEQVGRSVLQLGSQCLRLSGCVQDGHALELTVRLQSNAFVPGLPISRCTDDEALGTIMQQDDDAQNLHPVSSPLIATSILVWPSQYA